MEFFDTSILKTLYIPPSASHKSSNGKVLVIGGSELFHAASLWALEIASKIVDMVFYASVPENNTLVHEAKKAFRNGIIIPRSKIADYIQEADSILIGPGLPRKEGELEGDDDTKDLTESLLKMYPEKKWVIDGGSLQVIQPEVLIGLNMPILTPHRGEFEKLFNFKFPTSNFKSTSNDQRNQIQNAVSEMAEKYKCVILLKREEDVICSPDKCVQVSGGNSGMTKGGTGDVLAGLVAALFAKNEAFLSATAASFFNKKAGEALFRRVGYYFNASDLVHEIPFVMKEYIISSESTFK